MPTEVLATVGDCGLEQQAQPLVDVAGEGLRNARHGHVDDVGRGAGEVLPPTGPRSVGELHRPLRGMRRIPQGGRTTVSYTHLTLPTKRIV